MRIACIDIGTNSIRLLLADYENQKFTDVSKYLQMTRLGKGVNETGLLAADRIEESVDVITSYYEKSKTFGAEKIYMMATSAVRDSRNATELTQAVYDKTGCIIDVISGELEAEIGFLGVLLGLDVESTNTQDEEVLVIDIGGGSTELIIGDITGIKYATSLNIGAVRLTGAYVHHDPVLPKETEEMFHLIEREVGRILEAVRGYKVTKCIGIGGTATTFATMVHEVSTYSREHVHNLIVSLEDVSKMNAKLEHLSVEERKNVIGLESKRADIIYAGGLILNQIMKTLSLDQMIVSDFDNLEGLVAYHFKKTQ